MKRLALLVGAIAAVVAIPLLASAEEQTLKGEPVDITCYLQGRSGAGHAGCAASCANKGLPIGLLVEAEGKKQVYLVLGGGGKEAKEYMAAHMGKQVNCTGTVADKDGLKVITVTKCEAAS